MEEEQKCFLKKIATYSLAYFFSFHAVFLFYVYLCVFMYFIYVLCILFMYYLCILCVFILTMEYLF